jgi:hypothetical protein
MKAIKTNQCQCHHCDHAARGQCSGRQRAEQVRLLINTASAARGGPGPMTLNDWRELEQEVNERLQNEQARIQF